ncbi:hypothetical protein NDU88_010872 [Pleurodeles waltl]|uniref:Ig-like domain-containing protein n=1 Tax=Pleurodeles waltl TaxID=8319 RepID=A0AAV7PWH6_PLEWA|nr:hypothetical protein NDU88_010872 [Pleurodeles waltl]
MDISALCPSEDYTLTVTSPVRAQKGLCVLIPCTFTYEDTTESPGRAHGYWFIKGDPRDKAVATNDVNKQIYGFARGHFRLAGDVRSRDCSLSINDIRSWDKKTYFFRYEHSEASKFKWNYVGFPLRVTVLDLQDKPTIDLPPALTEGANVSVNCTAPGRCSGTPPSISWTMGWNSAYSTMNRTVNHSDDTQSHISEITFQVSREHNRKQLDCTAYFSTVGASATSSATLNVEYAPRIAAINSSSCQSSENAIMCICVVEAYPLPTIEWKINENILPESFQNGSMQQAFSLHSNLKNSTLIMNISDSPTLSITCIFSNKHGTGAEILKSPESFSTSSSQGASTGAIIGIAVAITLLFMLLVGMSLCITRKIRKKGNSGSGTLNEASHGTTVDSTYQELQRRQSDTYGELKIDRK